MRRLLEAGKVWTRPTGDRLLWPHGASGAVNKTGRGPRLGQSSQSLVFSAVTVAGEELLDQIRLPPIRRLDVFKAFFAFFNQVLATPDGTRPWRSGGTARAVDQPAAMAELTACARNLFESSFSSPLSLREAGAESPC